MALTLAGSRKRNNSLILSSIGDGAEGSGHAHVGGKCDLRDQGAVHRHASGGGRGRQRPGHHQAQPGGHVVVSWASLLLRKENCATCDRDTQATVEETSKGNLSAATIRKLKWPAKISSPGRCYFMQTYLIQFHARSPDFDYISVGGVHFVFPLWDRETLKLCRNSFCSLFGFMLGRYLPLHLDAELPGDNN